MPEFRLFNTLTRQIEAFAPADGETVRMYTCGPTVYNPAHLGNFRTFLFEDLLRRTLRLAGWRVQQIMNLTDVDDKIIRKAAATGQTIGQVTEPFTELFHTDRRYLRIEDAEGYPKATEHIPEMIALVERLIANGVAYLADDGSVYFAIDRFPTYGQLSQLEKREVRAGARVAQDEYAKENAQDFALWKSTKGEDDTTGASWNSPWGPGRPGWHLECSAMAMKYLGETFDLHAGGIDLIFPHHEDEIAQSEAATGKTFARCWCHGEFLLTDGAKMAKRVGNVANVVELRAARISGTVYRHFVFSTHYRKQLNMNDDWLEHSRAAVNRVGVFARRLAEATVGTPALAELAVKAELAFMEALFDDLNGPEAMAAMFVFISDANRELDEASGTGASRTLAAGMNSSGTDTSGTDTSGSDASGSDASGSDASGTDASGTDTTGAGATRFTSAGHDSVGPATMGTETSGNHMAALERARAAFKLMDGVLDLVPEEPQVDAEEGSWIEHQLVARKAARANRDFKLADAIRDEITARGFAIEDSATGTRWWKRF